MTATGAYAPESLAQREADPSAGTGGAAVPAWQTTPAAGTFLRGDGHRPPPHTPEGRTGAYAGGAVGPRAHAAAVVRRRQRTAALQVGLRASGLYAGSIDGITGPLTRSGVRRLQSARGLAVDGVAGPRTRRALGWRGRPKIGRRVIRAGARGWDVAALQFRLGTRGFPSGTMDGVFGPRGDSALRRFQAWAGLSADGQAGPATRRALRRRPARSPLRFLAPVGGPLGDRFGPRGDRFHTGVDYPVGAGTPVGAAGRGCVSFAGYDPGGYGNLVIISHRAGMTTYYAHLASISLRRGQCVSAGARVGTVGSTGFSTGPHLHFEMRLRGAAINPLTGL